MTCRWLLQSSWSTQGSNMNILILQLGTVETEAKISNILYVRRFYLAHAHVFTTTFIVKCNLLQSYASGIDCKLKNNISDRPISAKNTSTELVSL